MLEKLISFSDSFVLTGLIEAAAFEYSGLQIEELSLDEKAEILFLDQGYEILCPVLIFTHLSLVYLNLILKLFHFLNRSIATTVVLAVLYSLTKSFSPLPDDIYRYGNYQNP